MDPLEELRQKNNDLTAEITELKKSAKTAKPDNSKELETRINILEDQNKKLVSEKTELEKALAGLTKMPSSKPGRTLADELNEFLGLK